MSVAAMRPPQRRGGTVDAVRRLLMRRPSVQPRCCVIEDLHWIDTPPRTYLLSRRQASRRHRVLVVLTYRPGYAHPFGEHTYHTRLALNALAGGDRPQMVQGVLSVSVTADSSRLIARQGGGQSVLHRGGRQVAPVEDGALGAGGRPVRLARPLGQVAVPDTIQDVIMARIDRLPEDP